MCGSMVGVQRLGLGQGLGFGVPKVGSGVEIWFGGRLVASSLGPKLALGAQKVKKVKTSIDILTILAVRCSKS